MWVGLSALAAIAAGVVGAWLCRSGLGKPSYVEKRCIHDEGGVEKEVDVPSAHGGRCWKRLLHSAISNRRNEFAAKSREEMCYCPE